MGPYPTSPPDIIYQMCLLLKTGQDKSDQNLTKQILHIFDDRQNPPPGTVPVSVAVVGVVVVEDVVGVVVESASQSHHHNIFHFQAGLVS